MKAKTARNLENILERRSALTGRHFSAKSCWMPVAMMVV